MPCEHLIVEGGLSVYYGEDAGTQPQPTTVRLDPSEYENSLDAEAAFLAEFDATLAWEGFEGHGYADFTVSPFTFTAFSLIGETTLSSIADEDSTLRVRAEGATGLLGVGRFAPWGPAGDTTPDTDWRWLESTKSWKITFENAANGLGFWGVDLGDFNANLVLTFYLTDGSSVDYTLPYERNAVGDLPHNSSIKFVGLISATPFTRVDFTMDQGAGPWDVFGFDKFYVTAASQLFEPAIANACSGITPANLCGHSLANNSTCGVCTIEVPAATTSTGSSATARTFADDGLATCGRALTAQSCDPDQCV